MKLLNRLLIIVTVASLATVLIPVRRLEGNRIIQIFGAEFSLDLTLLFAFVLLALAGCAQDRYHRNLSHAAFAPSARRLPETERQEIVRLVSHATTETLLRVGQSDYERGVIIMNAVTGYHDHRVTMFYLTKTGGH